MGPELEEASSAAGAGWFDYFSRILLPLLKPTLFSVAIVVFISGIRDIPTVIFLATHESRTLSLLMLDYLAEANSRRQLCCSVCFSFVSKTLAVAPRPRRKVLHARWRNQALRLHRRSLSSVFAPAARRRLC